MKTHTTMLCYMNGEIITCADGIRYSFPPAKVVVTNTSATFDELEANICQSFSIDRMQTQLKMNFRYPVFGANGISNYIQISIKDEDDVRGMFIVVAQASPAVSIEMYLETFPIDHHAMSIGCSQREQIVEESMSPMGYDRMSSPVDCHTYEEHVETRMNSEMVIESVILMAKIFVDILVQNDDVDEDEPLENESSLLGDKCVGWFAKMDTKKWTQAYDGGFRYGLMTTNIVECINGVLKRARMLPITALVEVTFYQCVTYFEKRRAEIRARIAFGDMYTIYAMAKVANYESKASGHSVSIFH